MDVMAKIRIIGFLAQNLFGPRQVPTHDHLSDDGYIRGTNSE